VGEQKVLGRTDMLDMAQTYAKFMTMHSLFSDARLERRGTTGASRPDPHDDAWLVQRCQTGTTMHSLRTDA
jgi:hypothetical protein